MEAFSGGLNLLLKKERNAVRAGQSGGVFASWFRVLVSRPGFASWNWPGSAGNLFSAIRAGGMQKASSELRLRTFAFLPPGFEAAPQDSPEPLPNFAPVLIAAKSLKPCDGGVFGGLEFAPEKRAKRAWRGAVQASGAGPDSGGSKACAASSGRACTFFRARFMTLLRVCA